MLFLPVFFFLFFMLLLTLLPIPHSISKILRLKVARKKLSDHSDFLFANANNSFCSAFSNVIAGSTPKLYF